ncbi:methyltransferase domain protein [Ancylostoma duodenale]|uniref:Methyltransferase domain protein n=1 Tax=Ancylostoma duodenale TaxID=51022 RepID=A0A0C2GSE6_9BILA|nr:methyltransferase domain protein [Ancylostoma duodenale]
MPSFPSAAYSSAQSKWIGKEHIVAPTVERALDNWQLIKQKRVLDVGCGTGHIGREILDHGASEVIGLDSSEEMVENARKTFQSLKAGAKCQFIHASILDIDLHGFDVVVSFFALHFLKNKEELSKAIQNIYNSLTSDGVLVILVPNGVSNFNPNREEGQKFGAAINLKSDSDLCDGRRLCVEFFDNGEVVGSSEVTFFFNHTYEEILREAGFKKVEFLPPTISEAGLQQYGEDFFHSYMNPPKDVIIRAYKG